MTSRTRASVNCQPPCLARWLADLRRDRIRRYLRRSVCHAPIGRMISTVALARPDRTCAGPLAPHRTVATRPPSADLDPPPRRLRAASYRVREWAGDQVTFDAVSTELKRPRVKEPPSARSCRHGYVDYCRGRSQFLVRSQSRLVMCRAGGVGGASARIGACRVAPMILRTRCSSSVLGSVCGMARPRVAPTCSVCVAVVVHIGQSGRCAVTRESPAGSRACNAHPTASARCGQSVIRCCWWVTVRLSLCGPR